MGQMGIKKKMDIIHININLILYISNITFNSNTQKVHTKFTSRSARVVSNDIGAHAFFSYLSMWQRVQAVLICNFGHYRKSVS